MRYLIALFLLFIALLGVYLLGGLLTWFNVVNLNDKYHGTVLGQIAIGGLFAYFLGMCIALRHEIIKIPRAVGGFGDSIIELYKRTGR